MALQFRPPFCPPSSIILEIQTFMQAILLASSSSYRRQLLSKLGLDFDWQSPAIDETPQTGEPRRVPLGGQGPQQLGRSAVDCAGRSAADRRR